MRDAYAQGNRQIVVDVLRGYFIVSMASGHLAAGFLTDLLHAWRWVDAAAGFVCMSGFVLGLSQRSRWRRDPAGWGHLWILRRAAQIWAISVLLTLVGFSLPLFSERLTFIENIFTADRFWSALPQILTMQLEVPYFGLLSIYVVFLAVGFFAVAGLRRNLDYLVVGLSVGVYALSQLVFAHGQGMEKSVDFLLPAWQLLFFIGLWAGWRWQDGLQAALRQRQGAIFAVSTVGVLLFLVSAYAYKIPGLPFTTETFMGYFDKFDLNPLVVVNFALLMGFLAPLTVLLARVDWLAPLLRFVAMLGRHSLACYVLLTLLHAAQWLIAEPVSQHEGRHPLWFPVAVAVFALFCFLAEKRIRRGAVKAAGFPQSS